MSETLPDSGEPTSAVHRPVLLREVISRLELEPGQTVVDGTLGAGGHSRTILEQIGPQGTLIGLDRDPMMLQLARSKVSGSNCFLRHASYDELLEVLEELPMQQVDRILLDLGLSSDQLADDRRGFSFQSGGPLDLRFDASAGEPAWKLIEQKSETALADIFWRYGEERFSRRIARRLVARRGTRPVRTSRDLVEVVAESVPGTVLKKARRQPATRVFQALRIVVNDELNHLQQALSHVFLTSLRPEGRVVVISFHSLEDRLVKQAFRGDPRWRNLTPKPVKASPAEQRINPRCRTAKLRAAMKAMKQ